MKNFFKKLMSSKSQSKYFSETVQRVGKNNAGFSLVELIVVIAIMAILAAVAVIGVSVYIPKAQKAADEQMIADIEQALTLYYYSDPTKATDGFLVLNVEGDAQSNNAFIVEAMKATFGEDWQSELSLKYDEWNATFQGSNFYGDEQGLAGLLGTVETLTDALGGFLNKPSISEALGDGFNKYMEDMGATNADEKADAAVFYVADITAGLKPEALQNAVNSIPQSLAQGGGSAEVLAGMNEQLGSTIASAATMYALAEGYATFFEKGNYEIKNGTQTPRQILDKATADIEEKSGSYDGTVEAFGALLNAFGQMGDVNPEAMNAYMATTNGESPMSQDMNAYADAMKTVSSSKENIMQNNANNGAQLGADGYFTTDYMQDLVGSYAEGGVFVYIKVEDNGLKVTTSLEE